MGTVLADRLEWERVQCGSVNFLLQIFSKVPLKRTLLENFHFQSIFLKFHIFLKDFSNISIVFVLSGTRGR